MFELTLGRQSLPGTVNTFTTGAQEVVSASRGLSVVKRAGVESQIIHAMKSNRSNGYAYIISDPEAASHTKPAIQVKYADDTGKGHYQMWKDSHVLKHTVTNLKQAGSSGAAWSLPLSITGTTLQYTLDDQKEFWIAEFARDIGLDGVKGIVSGATAGATSVGSSILLSAFFGATSGSVMPVVGTVIGFVVGAIAGFLVAYKVEDVYQNYNLRQ